ncbi:MAG: AmmeMemoRadiSam system protein B [Bacteroidetes bacterium]|nr:AmmeMemoRadiSam system protein B [Bacteroidota bacterium]
MGSPASPVIKVALVGAFVVSVAFVLAYSVVNRGETNSVHYLPCQYSTFSEDTLFYGEAIRHARGSHRPARQGKGGRISLGIVTHHLLVKDLISAYFERLSLETRPTTIVLVGPNHRSRGTAPVAISALTWKTPFGIVEPDLEVVQALARRNLAEINEDAFYDEHSIGALVPFLPGFFPGTRIVPIIVRPDADSAQVIQLADWLAEKIAPDVVVIGSLDFSHYQPSPIAIREDEETLSIIQGFRTNQWRRAYVDSRKTLLLLLHAAGRIGGRDFEIVHHTNSGILLKKEDVPCTSYINGFFRLTH